jgi:hypothetical protein
LRHDVSVCLRISPPFASGNVKGLRALAINPVSSSPKAMARHRDLAIIAIKAKEKSARMK